MSQPDPLQLRTELARMRWQVDLLAQSEALCRSGSMELQGGTEVRAMSAGLQKLLGGTEHWPMPGEGMRLDALPWVPEKERRLLARFWRGATPGDAFEFEHSVLCADGQSLRVLHRGLLQPAITPGGAPVGVAILQDITERRDTQRRMQQLAHFDEVTGLANRAHLLHQIDGAVHAVRSMDMGFALVSVLVHRINELALTMGLAAGDSLATTMAARLREVAVAGTLIAYLGAGEFVLMLRHETPMTLDERRADVARQAELIRAALQQVVPMGPVEIFAQCRLGAALYPGDARDSQALLGAAQTARHEAASLGAVHFFSGASQARALRDLQLETALRQALQHDELSLVYQPQVCLENGGIVGAEALLRWTSAEWGSVPANEFIPVAERSGLIVAIGEWVIRQACQQIVTWQQAGLPPVRLSINVSPVQFQLGDVVTTIRLALADTGAPAGWLALETTEAALAHDGQRVTATLKSLQAMGIEIVLDDFGTGSSSLSSLRNLPIGLVKVDRSFVADITSEPESASVARSIINLAHGLRIPVLAEGVETEGQLNMLLDDGCDRIQGYLFSRPVSADELGAMLRDGKCLQSSRLADRPAHARTLLLVDDEPSILSSLKRLFRRDGYQVLTAASGAEALEVLARQPVDVIVSDQRMPGMMGVDFLRRTKALHPDTIRMTLSGFTDLQSIIDAVNEGAVYKFLTKPWDDDRLREHVAQAFAQKEMADENRRLQAQVTKSHAEQAALNHRLEHLLQRQRVQSELMQISAASLRDMIDALPVAVLGLAADGMLAYINQPAAQLLPGAAACLGDHPGAGIAALLAEVRQAGSPAKGWPVVVQHKAMRAWLTPMPQAQVGADHEAWDDRGEVLVLVPVA